jgi:hypothetical protein
MGHALLLLFLGFVAAPSLLANRLDWLREFYNKIAIYKALIGVFYVLYGILRFLDMLTRGFNLLYISAAFVVIILGFLLGFHWISQHFFKENEEIKKRLEAIYFKLSPYEGMLALAVFFFGFYMIVDSF